MDLGISQEELDKLIDAIFKGAGSMSKVIVTGEGVLVWNEGKQRYELNEPHEKEPQRKGGE